MSEQQRSDARKLIAEYKRAASRARALLASDRPGAARTREHHQRRRSTALVGLKAINEDLALSVAMLGDIEDDLAHARHFSPPKKVAELEEQQRLIREEVKRRLEFLSTIPETAERAADAANPDDERTVTP
jgi:hypothetical protein